MLSFGMPMHRHAANDLALDSSVPAAARGGIDAQPVVVGGLQPSVRRGNGARRPWVRRQPTATMLRLVVLAAAAAVAVVLTPTAMAGAVSSRGMAAATSAPANAVLAWRPFLDPLDAHAWWWVFLFPAIFFIAMGYKAVRLPSLHRFWPQVIKLTIQVSVGLLAVSALLFAVVEWLIPRLPAG